MEELVRDFIHSILPNVGVTFEYDGFYVNLEDEVINIGMCPDPEGDRLIQEFVFNEFGVAMDSFLIGILHEIGHIVTYDEEIYETSRTMYFLLQMSYDENHFDEYSYKYFNLPDEYAATKWAVNYYLTHQEECDKFTDIVL